MGELEPWMDENFIKGVFLSSAHENVNVKVIRDKNSGNAGYCFVEFQSPEAATKALNMNGSQVPNSSRSFKLNWASGGGLVDRRYVTHLHCRYRLLTYPGMIAAPSTAFSLATLVPRSTSTSWFLSSRLVSPLASLPRS